MNQKKFFRKHIGEFLMIAGALTAGIVSFFITLNVYVPKKEVEKNEANVSRGVAKTTGSVKVYIDEEPVNDYIKRNEIDNDENIGKFEVKDDVNSNEDETIYSNTNVDERVDWISENDNNFVIETESNKLDVKEPVEEKVFKFQYPISGDVIMDYAKNKLVYSETLKEWITHEGIDIKAELATPVKASEDGIVEGVKMDPRYGNTIIIAHENGYRTIYSNLSTQNMVYVGKKIKKGEIISGVGEGFGFEFKEGAHVHFEILDENRNSLDVVNFLQKLT